MSGRHLAFDDTIPAHVNPRVGRVIAKRYRLQEVLGSGGMGDVWSARQLDDGQRVAIKVLRPEHTGNSGLVKRFLREGEAAGLVKHPNVVRVFDVGQAEDGAPYIVQELLVGQDLAARLVAVGGVLGVDLAVALMLPIVEAVASLHERGVVHRDLKPGNIFLVREGGETTPKLLDFGVSRIMQSFDSTRITATGMMMGTPAYMAPEQASGEKDVDARADVWALGVILYELVTGRSPFSEEMPGPLEQIRRTEPRPLREVASYVPDGYADIVDRCLRRAREQRYASARNLADDLVALKKDLAFSATWQDATLDPPTRPLLRREPEPPPPAAPPSSKPAQRATTFVVEHKNLAILLPTLAVLLGVAGALVVWSNQ